MSLYLLDTHALIWLVKEPNRIPEFTRELLADPDNTRIVSAVSAMEITLKYRLGKWPQIRDLIENWDAAVQTLMAIETPLTPKQAFLAGSLDWEHRDPFDRMLVAQAIDLKVPLVKADAKITELPGLEILWK